MLLTLWSRSWIGFFTSFICLFESSLRSLIIFKSRIWFFYLAFQIFQYLWIGCWGVIRFLKASYCFAF
jgi:hypothetical protein